MRWERRRKKKGRVIYGGEAIDELSVAQLCFLVLQKELKINHNHILHQNHSNCSENPRCIQ